MPARELRSLAYKIAANKVSILRAVDRPRSGQSIIFAGKSYIRDRGRA